MHLKINQRLPYYQYTECFLLVILIVIKSNLKLPFADGLRMWSTLSNLKQTFDRYSLGT